MKIVEVVAAIILHDEQILCVQRKPNKYDYISLKYEFPGGKVEVGESRVEALRREITEELRMGIGVKEHFLTVNHQYPDFNIIMHSFLCSTDTRELTLVDHVDFQWLYRHELHGLDWAAADIPIVEQLAVSCRCSN